MKGKESFVKYEIKSVFVRALPPPPPSSMVYSGPPAQPLLVLGIRCSMCRVQFGEGIALCAGGLQEFSVLLVFSFLGKKISKSRRSRLCEFLLKIG